MQHPLYYSTCHVFCEMFFIITAFLRFIAHCGIMPFFRAIRKPQFVHLCMLSNCQSRKPTLTTSGTSALGNLSLKALTSIAPSTEFVY